MEYNKFIELLKTELMKVCAEGVKLKIDTVRKNNDISYDVITLNREDECITPVIYIRQFYDNYCNGEDISDIVRQIVNLDIENRNLPELDVSDIFDFYNVKDKVIIKLINRSQNEKMLKTLPFKEYLDFAVVFCILFEDNNNNRATSLVSNDLLDKWEITTEELFEQAMTNMKLICPAELKSMNETMVELLLNDDSVDDDTRSDILKHLEEDDTNYPMYVLTNTKKMYGAAAFLYEEELRSFAEKFGDFYIIPSSIHELILIPESISTSEQEMVDMVKEVNDNQVEPEEVLSYNVYKYYADTGCVGIINKIKNIPPSVLKY